MKVSELMDPAGVRLYANIKDAADVLGVLPERLEAIAASAVVPSHIAYYLADAAHARSWAAQR